MPFFSSFPYKPESVAHMTQCTAYDTVPSLGREQCSLIRDTVSFGQSKTDLRRIQVWGNSATLGFFLSETEEFLMGSLADANPAAMQQVNEDPCAGHPCNHAILQK